MSAKTFAVPQWIFDAPDGDYYLLSIRPDGSVDVDGGHSDPQGVVNARELHESIACIRKPGTRYVMLRVEAVPDAVPVVNRDAIRTLNTMKETR